MRLFEVKKILANGQLNMIEKADTYGELFLKVLQAIIDLVSRTSNTYVLWQSKWRQLAALSESELIDDDSEDDDYRNSLGSI